MSSDRTLLKPPAGMLSARDFYAFQNSFFLQLMRANQIDRVEFTRRVATTFRGLCQLISPTTSLEIGTEDATFSRWMKKARPGIRAIALGANPSVKAELLAEGIECIGADAAATHGWFPWTQHARTKGGVAPADQCVSFGDDERIVASVDTNSDYERVLTGSRMALQKALAVFIEVESIERQPGQWVDSDVAAFMIQLGFIPAFRDQRRARRFNYVYLKPSVIEQPKLNQKVARVFAPAVVRSAEMAYSEQPLQAMPNPRGPVVLQGGPLFPDTTPCTVAIFGLPRGGTTMVAGVARRCGLFIGNDLPGNLEDQDFVNKDIEHMEAAVAERNASRKAWGWKYPRSSDYLPELLPKLRNPRFVVIWRDLLAAGGRGVAKGGAPQDALHSAARIQNRNLRFVADSKMPILHVSYEKAIRDPIPFIEALAAFVGGKRPADLAEVIAFMEPGSYKPVEDSD